MYNGYKNKEKRKRYLQEWRIQNRLKIREYFRDYFEQNRDKFKKYYTSYYDRNKNKYHKYHSAKIPGNSDYFKNASPISKISIYRHGLNALKIFEKFNGKCGRCNQDWDLTIHHKDRKGRNLKNKGEKPNNNIDNLILLCRRCHGSIHGKQGGRPKGGQNEHQMSKM